MCLDVWAVLKTVAVTQRLKLLDVAFDNIQINGRAGCTELRGDGVFQALGHALSFTPAPPSVRPVCWRGS